MVGEEIGQEGEEIGQEGEELINESVFESMLL